MIYLSGKLRVEDIGTRPDIGVMVGYRPKGGPGVGTIHLGRTPWGGDNGCFKNPDLDVDAYLGWLDKLTPYLPTCLFATAPDVVGDAGATWERSRPVLPLIRRLGYPAAFVAQEGLEDMAVEWDAFDVLFIGGKDCPACVAAGGRRCESVRRACRCWKLSEAAFGLIAEAKRRGKWAHMGRVNSRRRLRVAKQAGCDSADGTHFVYRPDLYRRRMENWLDELRGRPFLNMENAA